MTKRNRQAKAQRRSDSLYTASRTFARRAKHLIIQPDLLNDFIRGMSAEGIDVCASDLSFEASPKKTYPTVDELKALYDEHHREKAA
jgi:hypothetical protein